MIVDDPSSFRRGAPPAAAPPSPPAAAAASGKTGPISSTRRSHSAALSTRKSNSCKAAPALKEETLQGARVDPEIALQTDGTSGSRGGSATPIETANPEAGILVGKRKSYDTGGDDRSLPQPKYTETVGRSRGRMRLTLGQKLEILQLLDEEKMTRLEIARIYKCSDRTVSSCFANRATLRAEAGSAARKLKSKGRRAVGFPEVDRRVLALVEAFRKKNLPVSRTTIASFGHAVKASLLCSDTAPAEDKAKLMTFGASEKWTKNFVSRNGLVSKPVLFSDGGVGGHQRIHESLKEVQKDNEKYDLGSIRFDETGPLPKRSYLSSSEARDTESATPVAARGGVDV